jgi:predicted PurR-regulated permease PerM
MSESGPTRRSIKPYRFSFCFMLGLLVLMIWHHLAALLLAGLFTYLALSRLQLRRRGGKLFALAIFLLLFSGIVFGLGNFASQTVKALPDIAEKSIPSIIAWAKQYHIELPFADYDSLKEVALDTVKSEARYLASFARFARGASAQLLFVVAGCVVAISLFLHDRVELGREESGGSRNPYAQYSDEIIQRFRTFYRSFVTVMGAQIIIAAINTVLTAIFAAVVGLPYAVVVVGMTFLCGLLPVIGNLISNTVIVAIGFTVSPKMALVALVFLVVIHKLEYLLNSQIVGWRIRNPLWLTLLALIVGERLLGVPGLVLAPVVLNYVRMEASHAQVPETEHAEEAVSI